MTHHRPAAKRPARPEPDVEETKAHVMAAGRELLLAARGALFFCKDYVETQVPEASRPNLLGFFQKAIAVADELSRGIAGVATIKKAAEGIAKPLFTAMEREMRREAGKARQRTPTVRTDKPRQKSKRAESSKVKGQRKTRRA